MKVLSNNGRFNYRIKKYDQSNSKSPVIPLLIAKLIILFGCLWLLPSQLKAETDLDVTLIERTPRYDYNVTKNNPQPGDIVTFHGHIINWSDTTIESHYQWLIDGQKVNSGIITNFTPSQERVLDLSWQWQSGNHYVSLIVDPNNLIAEQSEANNSITDRTNALIAGFWVEQSVYDYFHQYQKQLGCGSNSWQDWIQRQMARQNQLYAQAIWPQTPQGVLDRVRIDKIIVVPDGALPLHGGLPTNNPDMSDKTVDLMWGFPATLLEGNFYANHTSTDENNPFYLEKSLIHELGHARYLIDCYGFDVSNTTSHDAVQIWEGDTYVAGSKYMPFIAWDSVLYYNKSGGVMSGPYGFQWSPYEAAALNLIAGHRAVCGNYNAPCNIGIFLQDLPAHNHVRFVDANGKPWAGADVRIYQAAPGPGWYGKTFDNIPDQYYTTDPNGYVHLPRNPFNPGGNIIHTYGQANGVFIFRIAYGNQIWYRFMEVPDFNMQYWAGNTQNAHYTIELDGNNYQDTTPPTDPNNLTAQQVTSNSLILTWSPSTDNIAVLGYNIYRNNQKIASVNANNTTFQDDNLTGCTDYSYTVTAYDAFNESGHSLPCNISTPAPPQNSDLNNDGLINLTDLIIMVNNWLDSNCGITGDLNADQQVNIADFALLTNHYLDQGQTIPRNWPVKQHDMWHTGRAWYRIPPSRLNNTFFDNILWQKPSPQSPDNGNFGSTSMVFFDNVGPNQQDIVIGGYHWPKGVQGMNRHNGALLWQGNPEGGETIGNISPAFSIDGHTVYVVNDATSHPLMAFATNTNPHNYWHNGTDSQPDHLALCSPTIGPGGRIWLHRWNDRPYAGTDYGDHINQSWAAASEVFSCFSDPTLYEDAGHLIVVSGGRTNTVKAWDGQNGTELWSATTSAGTDATVTIDPDNGNIYLPAGFDDIYIVGLNKNGQPLWNNPAILVYDSQSGSSNPQRAQSCGCLSYDGNTFYFQTNNSNGHGKLYAINTSDGSVKWSYPTNSKGWEIHSSCPIVTINNVIIVGNNLGQTYFAIQDTPSGPVLLDTITVANNGTAQASATLSTDGILYLPLRIKWTKSNGDNDNPDFEIENVFTAFDMTENP